MEDLLRKKKLRVTDFRLAVLAIFSKYDHAISTEEIEQELKEFDRITLYRTLKSFTEKGIIHEINYPQEEKRLALCADACTGDHHHHQHIHFKCKECGEITCSEIDALPDVSLNGFHIEQLEIQAQGLCGKCH
jgi:Fur family ferric uptake transcriptional regulator